MVIPHKLKPEAEKIQINSPVNMVFYTKEDILFPGDGILSAPSGNSLRKLIKKTTFFISNTQINYLIYFHDSPSVPMDFFIRFFPAANKIVVHYPKSKHPLSGSFLELMVEETDSEKVKQASFMLSMLGIEISHKKEQQ